MNEKKCKILIKMNLYKHEFINNDEIKKILIIIYIDDDATPNYAIIDNKNTIKKL